MLSLQERAHGNIASLFLLSRMSPRLLKVLVLLLLKYKALAASAKGDLRVPVEAFQPGESPQTFHSSAQLTLPVEFMDELSSFTAGEPNFSR